MLQYVVTVFIIIIITILGLNDRRNIMAHLFLTLGEFPSYWDWLWCPGLSPVLVFIALLFAFHSWCFLFALICHWISIVFLLYSRRIATHSVVHSLTHCLGESPGLGPALVPNVVVPETDSGAHGAENSIQISALAEVEPRTLASNRAPLLLVASYDMQEATAGDR